MKRNTAGYTLIELLLYISIAGILLLAVTSFFQLTLDARAKSQTIMEVDEQGTALMEYITQTVRNADSITTPVAGATGSSLTIAVPTAGLSPTIFDLTGTTAQVKEGVATAVALTNNKVQISSLTFKNLTRGGTFGAVQVSFTVTRVNTSGLNAYDYSKTFTTTVALR
ncbi:MAG TPA: prepilin-type N-terminal cleavage/methylation domain-containing protein [Verrucomicrobiae bacterium]|nr:prepilin-type N-terminal cleavage/methylation domain-containing protein [Verrucomicrobiae bacterium]